MNVQLEQSWLNHLQEEFTLPYMHSLKDFLSGEIKKKKTIYPHGKDIFNALNWTPFESVKVVIIGQDPYHGPGQAHGLCFSVPPKIPAPPSLINIFDEIKNDLGIAPPNHGNLENWAHQGVLLLNSVLTVERGRAASHRNQGWERFSDKIVELLNREREGLVFLLWGSYAIQKAAQVDKSKHLVLSSPHPSPLSAHRGFFGGHHFSRANDYLLKKGKKPIDWSLPPLQ